MKNNSLIWFLIIIIVVIYIYRYRIGEQLKKLGVISDKFITPVVGKITSAFGPRIIDGKTENHSGIDISSPVGTKIKAPESGIVENVYFTSLGGNQIIIKHDGGFQTGYAHLEKTFVRIGDRVRKGQIIGTVGMTGRTTGAHLHFTMRDNYGNLIDPSKYV